MTLLSILKSIFPEANLDYDEGNDCIYSSTGEDIFEKHFSEDDIKYMARLCMNYIYGIPNSHILLKKEFIDTDGTSIPVDEWDEIPENVLCGALKVSDILDDATTHVLSFKYENGKYYIKPNECDPN